MKLRMTIMILVMFALSACATNEVTPTPQADGQTGYKSFLDRPRSPAFHQMVISHVRPSCPSWRMLGMMYYQGQGVGQDFDKARDNFLVSANAGIAEAQGMIGSMYAEAKGFRQSYVKAARWYERAAEQGFAPAQSILGHMYGAGQGVSLDYGKARYWLRKAANQGDSDAQFHLGLFYHYGEGLSVNSPRRHV